MESDLWAHIIRIIFVISCEKSWNLKEREEMRKMKVENDHQLPSIEYVSMWIHDWTRWWWKQREWHRYSDNWDDHQLNHRCEMCQEKGWKIHSQPSISMRTWWWRRTGGDRRDDRGFKSMFGEIFLLSIIRRNRYWINMQRGLTILIEKARGRERWADRSIGPGRTNFLLTRFFARPCQKETDISRLWSNSLSATPFQRSRSGSWLFVDEKERRS